MSLEQSKLAFIGSGAMAEAIIKGILAKGLIAAERISASDPIPARQRVMAETYGVQTTGDNDSAIAGADIVIMSIKPQVFGKVAAGLQGKLGTETLVLSIMAGITSSALQEGLAHERVVRAMPNTPAQLNMGVTAWMPTATVTTTQREQTALILGALGEQIPVEKEEYIDMQTGLGGSGPGFVLLLVEAMIDAGVQMGFSRADSQTIVLQTMAGSVALVKETGKHPAELRNLVTSPGGTTAAGIYELEKAGVRTALSDAIFAAYRRSQELGKSS